MKIVKRVILILIVIIVLLWFLNILPPKVAIITGMIYMSQEEDGDDYKLIGSEFSSAHGDYFVFFVHKKTSMYRNLGIKYKFIPINVYFDSNKPFKID